MTTIWAYKEGEWRPGRGWEHTVPFRSLDQLSQELRLSRVKHGTIIRLAIVAHGNRDGQILLEPPLTSANYQTFRRQLDELAQFLHREAFVELYCCVTGAGTQGQRLLVGLSQTLAGRTIVGFEVNIGFSGFTNTAGMANNTQANELIPNDYFSPAHYHARWARNGIIIRESTMGRDRQRRCGSPECRGHYATLDHCEGWLPTPPSVADR